MNSSILEFRHVHCCKQGFQSKLKNRMANSEDPDEMAGTAVNRGFSLNSKTEWQMCTLSVGLALSKLILPPVYLVIS